MPSLGSALSSSSAETLSTELAWNIREFKVAIGAPAPLRTARNLRRQPLLAQLQGHDLPATSNLFDLEVVLDVAESVAADFLLRVLQVDEAHFGADAVQGVDGAGAAVPVGAAFEAFGRGEGDETETGSAEEEVFEQHGGVMEVIFAIDVMLYHRAALKV